VQKIFQFNKHLKKSCLLPDTPLQHRQKEVMMQLLQLLFNRIARLMD